MNIHFVYTGQSKFETEVVKELQPERLLLSYWYHKRKSLEAVIQELGYEPKIMLDSGAWSAYTKGKSISILDYMKYIDENRDFIDSYISLDVIGDAELSKRFYDIMWLKGYKPLPVYHKDDSISYLIYYAKRTNYICLGGTAMEKSKPLVREWVQEIQTMFPDRKFHLLGSSSKQITDHCNIESFDSSTWAMLSVNGFPKEISGRDMEAKTKRGIFQMKKLMGEYAQ